MILDRKFFLQRKSISDALNDLFIIIENSFPLDVEDIPIGDSIGRVTGVPHFAILSSPEFNAAAMDGIAVKAVDTYMAKDSCPVLLKLEEKAQWINTGQILPEEYDSVIMVENIVENGVSAEIREAVAPYTNVRPAGEDFVSGELLLSENQIIRVEDIAALASGGYESVCVRRKPNVAIIPTGDELVDTVKELSFGKSLEHNALVLSRRIIEWGGVPNCLPIIPDEYNKLKNNIMMAADKNDIVVVIAGSSAGSKDFTASAIQEIGNLLVHGVKIKPGKPTIIGSVNGKPVVGLPGYPLASFINSDIFIKPLIAKAIGINVIQRDKIKGTLTKKIVSSIGEREFVLVKLGKVKDRVVVIPLSRGSGVTSNLLRADGLIEIPEESQGIDSGKEFSVELFRRKIEIENTIVSIGSHDMCQDILASEIRKKYPDIGFSSSHVGSFAGFAAVASGNAHMAGVHSLDETNGIYNIAYADKFLKSGYVLINLVRREQGLMVAPGNPCNIRSIQDIAEKRIKYINRQKSAGTRQLFDYYLKKYCIDSSNIENYDREVFTHLSVAMSIKSKTADVGMGIRAAAYELGLDFIPVQYENYDLLIGPDFIETDIYEKMTSILRSSTFIKRILQLPGYDTSHTGVIVAEKR